MSTLIRSLYGIALFVAILFGCGAPQPGEITASEQARCESEARAACDSGYAVATVTGIGADEAWSCECAERPVATAEPRGIGALEQAIVAQNGHGLAGDGGRCLNPTWAGGQCWLPEEKGWVISYFDISANDPEYPANYSWWKDRLKGTLPFFEDNMEDRGWGIALPGDNAQFHNFKVKCGEAGSASNPNALGSTIPAASWPNIVQMSQGELRKFTSVAVVIDCKDIQANAAFQALQSWQKIQYVINVVNHELYHAVGLGHVVGFACPNMVLMNDVASGSCWYTTSQNITSQERGFLEAFQGDGD